ncbi:MAG: hypothetical protein NVS1B13_06210 [Flavisolibacter sp.]
MMYFIKTLFLFGLSKTSLSALATFSKEYSSSQQQAFDEFSKEDSLNISTFWGLKTFPRSFNPRLAFKLLSRRLLHLKNDHP